MMHPLFLIGLVAVAIPIAVHLFNFRRYKKVYFSNVEYLEQLQTETGKAMRQWIVDNVDYMKMDKIRQWLCS